MVSKLNMNHPNEISKCEQLQNYNCKKGGTKLERILCIITTISLFTVAAMVASMVVLGFFYQKNTDSGRRSFASQTSSNLLSSDSSASNLCLTSGCVKAAAEILSNLDESVKPCNDFYRFACGGWLDRNVIPEDRSYVDVFSKTEDNLNLMLKALLEKKVDGTEPHFIKTMKEMYDTCMDIKSIEKAGAKPLRKILKNLGGWPVVEGSQWNENKFDWIKTLMTIRKLGYRHNMLLKLSVRVDWRNNLFHILQLDQTSLGMPDRSYLISGLNDTATAAYFKKMVKAATFLGANETEAESELLEALQFEMTLAKYSLPREERRNITKLYNKFTVKELQDTITQIPWLEYFSGLLENEIFENETLIVFVPEFVQKFATLIASTEKRVIANYMLWRVVSESLPLLSKKWRDIALEYSTALTGKRQEEPRWEKCLSHLTDELWIALSFYYVSHFFKEENKEAASELVKYIHQEFLHNLDKIDWMDKETKSHAKAKADNMLLSIGYPEELLNKTIVSEHYQNLILSSGNYFENLLRLQKWSTDKTFDLLRKPNIRGEWKKYAYIAVVNAFYLPTDNGIDILAGILQNPFFRKDRPNYLNFGAIGYIIGHEITHGFDDQGRQYDKDGNNVNWWAKTTDERFKKKAQCIIDQYSNYTAENDMKLNGVNTQGENIADNGGLKQAYQAYQTWIKDNGQEQLLPGLKYTQNQLFWISAANIWCAKYRPEDLKLMVLSHYHSPDEFRVIGPMSNLAEFANDFNCPADSPMNKKHKCQIW